MPNRISIGSVKKKIKKNKKNKTYKKLPLLKTVSLKKN